MSQTNPCHLEAFCMTCPSAEEVITVLRTLGFHLNFQMGAMTSAYALFPPLPAQYHYRDEHGTEVIFLAGQDADMDEEDLPRHASRFWLCAGANPEAYQRVAQVVAAAWSFSWQRTGKLKDVA